MANPEHMELVKQGASAIAEWRRKNPGLQLDHSRADLTKSDLTEAILREANLTQADLSDPSIYDESLDRLIKGVRHEDRENDNFPSPIVVSG